MSGSQVLHEDLPRLIGDVCGVINSAKPAARKAASAKAADTALAKVMQSSRVRAWVPPHLIESLGKD